MDEYNQLRAMLSKAVVRAKGKSRVAAISHF